MSSLNSKHILITGASAGIGAELARAVASQGARVSMAARRLERLDALAPELLKLGAAGVHCYRCDVSEREQLFELARQARAASGEIDIWVSNAGAGLRHRLLEATEEQMLAMYRLNCLSALWAYQAVIPAWLASGHRGQIIDIGSLGGKAGYAFNAAYCAAKHGMSALGDTARQELLGSGIAITTVYPGPTVSDFGSASPDVTGGEAVDSVARARASRSLLRRKISSRQPTEAVVRSILRAMQSRQPTVYPHRWANLGVLLNNLLPGLTLRLMERTQRA